MDGCEILHQLVTHGNYETLYIINGITIYNGINHLPTGAGFLPSTAAMENAAFGSMDFLAIKLYLVRDFPSSASQKLITGG